MTGFAIVYGYIVWSLWDLLLSGGPGTWAVTIYLGTLFLVSTYTKAAFPDIDTAPTGVKLARVVATLLWPISLVTVVGIHIGLQLRNVTETEAAKSRQVDDNEPPPTHPPVSKLAEQALSDDLLKELNSNVISAPDDTALPPEMIALGWKFDETIDSWRIKTSIYELKLALPTLEHPYRLFIRNVETNNPGFGWLIDSFTDRKTAFITAHQLSIGCIYVAIRLNKDSR